MRALIQRVSKASVQIDGEIKGQVGQGLLILLGIEHDDNTEDIGYLIKKVSQLRIFNDTNGVMNISIQDIQGEFLVISQFTLHANTAKGNRPSYIKAARPEQAIPLYEEFISRLKETTGLLVETGEFGANMQVELVNDGPVTILIDSKKPN